MQFLVSSDHVKQKNREAAFFALLLIFAISGCIAAIVNVTAMSEMVFPALGIFLLTPQLIGTYKRIKLGAAAYPVIELEETTGTIAVSHKDITVTVDITKIKNLRLQHKSEQLSSAIVTTSSGEVMRFEGYENLEILASALERLTPKENVTNAKRFHR
jgi:hypothetical protein